MIEQFIFWAIRLSHSIVKVVDCTSRFSHNQIQIDSETRAKRKNKEANEERTCIYVYKRQNY